MYKISMDTNVVFYLNILYVILHHRTHLVCAQCSGSPKKIDVGYKSQTIKFPESGEYGTSLTCQWLLSSTVSGAILFKSTDIEVDCTDSYNIYDGSNNVAPVKHTGVCTTGSSVNHPLDRSSGQNLFIEFISDGISSSGKDKGFTIFFLSSTDLSNCSVNGSVITTHASDTPQAFTSPSFPSTYPRHHRCDWIIYPTISSATITLSLYYVDIDFHNGKCYDKLRVSFGPQTDEVCGYENFFPNKTYTNGGSGAITVTFTSDNTQEESGFVAVFVQSASLETATSTHAPAVATGVSTTLTTTHAPTVTIHAPTAATEVSSTSMTKTETIFSDMTTTTFSTNVLTQFSNKITVTTALLAVSTGGKTTSTEDNIQATVTKSHINIWIILVIVFGCVIIALVFIIIILAYKRKYLKQNEKEGHYVSQLNNVYDNEQLYCVPQDVDAIGPPSNNTYFTVTPDNTNTYNK